MKISIITPCYNSERTIERTIKSVINQKIDCELEYIIVDGKSKDNTCKIIEKYAQQYKCIKWISEKDNSMTEALNKGLKMATGDIIATINADDIYLKDALNNVINEYKKDPSMKVCIVNTYFVDENTNRVLSKNKPKIFNEFICALIECPFPECSIFYHRECIDNVGLFNEKIKYTQDLEYYLRLYKYGYKFKYKNIDASVFFRSDDNYSTIISDKMDEEVISYFKYKKIYKLFSRSFVSKIIKIIMGIRVYYIKTKKIEMLELV